MIVAVTLCSAFSVSAKTLTWAECVELAKQNNLELQIAESNVAASNEQAKSARSGFFPHLSASASKTQSSLSGVTSDSYGAQLSLTQNLFAGFADLNKTRQGELNLQVAQLNLQIAKAKLSADLKQNFEGLLYAQASSLLTADIKKRREENLRNVELRFNGGRENKGSVLLSRAYFSQASYEDTQSQSLVGIAREQLARTLGLASTEDWSITGTIPYLPKPTTEPNFSSLVEKVPDYLIIQAQERLARADVDVAEVNFYPSLDLTGTYGRVDPTWFPETERWNAGISLTIPLFDGGRDYYNVKAASAKLASAQKAKENSLQVVKTNLRQAYTDFYLALEKSKVDDLFRSAAETRADIARNKYNNGLMTFDDWDIIENDLINKQKANLVSHRQQVYSEALWEQAQGVGVIP